MRFMISLVNYCDMNKRAIALPVRAIVLSKFLTNVKDFKIMFTVKLSTPLGFDFDKSFVMLKDAFRYYNSNKCEGVNTILLGVKGELIEGFKTF